MQTTYDNFIGGVNNFTDPQKLGPTDAVDVLDADVVTGSVRSIKLPKDIPTPSLPAIANNSDGQRSVVRFGEAYYSSNNVTGELTSTLGYMGVLPPQERIGAIRGFPGERFNGKYNYAVMFRTKDGFHSAPGSTNMQDRFWVTAQASRVEVDILSLPADEFNQHRYLRYGHKRSPSTTQTIPGFGFGYLEGTIVQHKSRYYRAAVDVFSLTVYPDDSEFVELDSGLLVFSDYKSYGTDQTRHLHRQLRHFQPLPSPPDDKRWEDITTDEILVTGSDSFVLTLPTSNDPAVKEVVILRTTSGGAIFFEVAAVTNGERTFIDTLSDTDLLLSHSPPLNGHPPIVRKDTLIGGKYLTELHEVFYLAVGDRLYVSEQSNPHAWDPLKYLVFDEEITALVSADQSIIVFTLNHRYVITGTSFADLAKKQLPTAQGCPNWRTTATVGNHIVWQSNDGVAVFGKQPEIEGDRVELLTAKRYKFDTIANFAVAGNEVYYLFFDDHAVAIDFKHDLKITRLDLKGYLSAHYDQGTDRLYFQSPLSWQEAYRGSDASWSYTTPRLEPVQEDQAEATRPPKKLRRLWIDADSAVDVDVYVDGEYSWTKSITKRPRRDLHTYFRSGIVGQDIQFRFRSKGVMRSFTIDYRISRG